MWRWMQARIEARRIAVVLERENEQLRLEAKTAREHYDRLLELCRALRDVNADLDTKLLRATDGQG